MVLKDWSAMRVRTREEHIFARKDGTSIDALTAAMDPVFLYQPAEGCQCCREYQSRDHDNVSRSPLHLDRWSLVLFLGPFWLYRPYVSDDTSSPRTAKLSKTIQSEWAGQEESGTRTYHDNISVSLSSSFIRFFVVFDSFLS